MIRTLLRNALQTLERNPASFPALDHVPERITKAFPRVTLRKIRLVSGKHNFRIIVAHWDRGDREDHVDGLYAFPRRDGYPIDWDWVDRLLSDQEPTR